DNIVNANTNGYKRTLTEFSSIVIGSASDTTYTAGGVRSFVKRDITAVGTLESTNNATDIAVSGSGFVPITPSQSPTTFDSGADAVYLSTTGSFTEDAAGYLANSAEQYLLGWPLDSDGSFTGAEPSRNSFTDLEPVNARIVTFNAVPTSEIRLSGPLPVSATEVGADGTAIIHNEEYFDTIGDTSTLTYTFTPTVPGTGAASNTWTLDVTDSASTTPLIGRFTVVFNAANSANAGTIDTVTEVDTDSDGTNDATGTFDEATGMLQLTTASTSINTFIGIPDTSTGLTQTGSLSTSDIRLVSKDGSGYGEYKGVQIDSDGIVRAFFTNDQSRPIYQVPVVAVANANEMEPVGNQAYSVTPESGSITLSNSGDQLTGRIVGFALGKSTVDVAQELTHLIETQRAYSSNAKIIQTVDEMFQETTNLKR
ncbi:MAG: flagellar hook-basal body complex protein, partial [Pseudomonadota bacterium]